MAHQHAHGENGHSHEPKEFNNAFLVSIVANGLFVLVQIFYAYVANSTSLLADAVHNLGDVLSLILAWVANILLKRQPTERSTYGLKKSSILAALANGVLLVFSCGIIATEAMYKFTSPEDVKAISVMVVAGIGILVNGATAALFIRGMDDLNIRGAYLHLFYDALVSVGVVISAALLYFTGWQWIDPLMGLLIAFVILKGTWALFSDSLRLIVDAVPRGISLPEVLAYFEARPGVKQVHDLHIWALSTRENALSVHLWMPQTDLTDEARLAMVTDLAEKFNIHHATIQVERDLAFCNDACAVV